MWTPIPVIELELTRPLSDQQGDWRGHREVHALLRWHGTPLAAQRLPLADGQLVAEGLAQRLIDEHLDAITRLALADALLAGQVPNAATLAAVEPPDSGSGPNVSVVICTRDRPEDLRLCLASVRALDPRPFEVLVIENAPSDDATQRVVAEFREVRYIQEPRPGLDWTRNRGIREAQGEIVAFADDDVVLDSRWSGAIMQAFERHPSLSAVLGLIAPFELATPSQEHFELHGGFGRGYLPRWVHYPAGTGMPFRALGTGSLGSGANMAFRRDVFERVGPFLPALDTGTATEGGGDLEILYRVLKYGFPVAYEPRALCWHRHRREPEQLARQIGSWGVATYAMLESVRRNFPDERVNTVRYGLAWGTRLVSRSVSQYLRPGRIPRRVRLRELRGALVGRSRYHTAAARAQSIAEQFDTPADAGCPQLPPLPVGRT